MLDFCIKCLKMTQLFSIYFVELCTYIIPNVYNNVQTRQIYELTQGNGAFILIACYCNFWDREVHEWDIEKTIQKHNLVCEHLCHNHISYFTSNGGLTTG